MNKQKTQFGFTIVELLVAMFLVVILLGISAMVFRRAVEAQRAAAATAEIMQKYNAIAHQLRNDLQNLNPNVEICVAWVPVGIDTDGDGDVDVFTRMDRIYFFALSRMLDYHTYNLWPVQGQTEPVVLYGNTARICYMLAGDGRGTQAAGQPANKRILGRSQHLFTTMPVVDPDNNNNNLIVFPNPANYGGFTAAQNNYYEFDRIPSLQWTYHPTWFEPPAESEKANMVEQSIDIDVDSTIGGVNRGIQINPADAENLHSLLAQGVGEFKVQGWFEAEMRWIPEVDPDGDGDLSDTDFFWNGTGFDVAWLLYPRKFYSLPGYGIYPLEYLDLRNFNMIPGLGRALKFTFTLYDSKGVFPDGKTFTYIVDVSGFYQGRP